MLEAVARQLLATLTSELTLQIVSSLRAATCAEPHTLCLRLFGRRATPSSRGVSSRRDEISPSPVILFCWYDWHGLSYRERVFAGLAQCERKSYFLVAVVSSNGVLVHSDLRNSHGAATPLFGLWRQPDRPSAVPS